MGDIKLKRQTADGTLMEFEGDSNDYAVVYSVHGVDPMAVMLHQTAFLEQLQARLMPPSVPALPPAPPQHFLPPTQDYQAILPPAPVHLAQTEVMQCDTTQSGIMPMTRHTAPARRFNIAWTDFILPAIVVCTFVAVVSVMRYRQEHPPAGTTGDKKTQVVPDSKPSVKPKSDNAVQPFPFALPK